MANKTLTHQQLAGVVRKRLGAGRTLQQVADEFAISISTVRRLRDDDGTKRGDAHAEPAKVSTNGNGSKPKAAPAKTNGKATPAKTNGKATPAKTTGDVAVVKAAELHRWLSDVLPFAGTDDTLPMLRCIKVESDGKRLLAATTDRFTMGVSKLGIPQADSPGGGIVDPLDDVEFLLGHSDVATLLKIAKTARRDSEWRLVTIRKASEIPSGCTVPVFSYEFAFATGDRALELGARHRTAPRKPTTQQHPRPH